MPTPPRATALRSLRSRSIPAHGRTRRRRGVGARRRMAPLGCCSDTARHSRAWASSEARMSTTASCVVLAREEAWVTKTPGELGDERSPAVLATTLLALSLVAISCEPGSGGSSGGREGPNFIPPQKPQDAPWGLENVALPRDRESIHTTFSTLLGTSWAWRG